MIPLLPTLAVLMTCSAIILDVTSEVSIKNAASTVAYGMMKYYSGNITNTESTIAVLPSPYYWWQSGAMWGAMLDYQHNTGDVSYEQVIGQALSSQRGPQNDFMVPLHVKDEGNDDQAFWGFAAMSAAEKNVPCPVPDLTWIDMTQNLWNTQVRRWDTSSCGGGLRWQIFDFNKGYDYKNSISNSAFFQLSARLARFTGNQTYVDWANKSYDWMVETGLVDSNYTVFDGVDAKKCDTINSIEWSYNNAVIIYGAAVMYNHTNASPVWAERVHGFLDATARFFGPPEVSPMVMFEPTCEPQNKCNTDQKSFKAYLSRFLWATTLMVPSTTEQITSQLTISAQAAAKSCSGGPNGVTCGERWYVDGFDGSSGVGQYMSALEVMQGLLLKGGNAPFRSADLNEAPSPTTVTLPVTSTVKSVEETTNKLPTPNYSQLENLVPLEYEVNDPQSVGNSSNVSVSIASGLAAPSNSGGVPKPTETAKHDKDTRLDDSSIFTKDSSVSMKFASIPRCYTFNCSLVTVFITLLVYLA